MGFFSCATNDYDLLYAKYLSDPAKILRIAEYDPNKDTNILDLCGGTGAVAKAAMDMGAKDVILVDKNPRCEGKKCIVVPYRNGEIFQHRVSAERFNFLEDQGYDLIVCRQAVNYLNINKAFKNVFNHLKHGGRFVFNTFLENKRFVSKKYIYNNKFYSEFSFSIFKRVFHIQKMPIESKIDFTVFKYMTIEDLMSALLKAGFNSIELIREGNSTYYICTKE